MNSLKPSINRSVLVSLENGILCPTISSAIEWKGNRRIPSLTVAEATEMGLIVNIDRSGSSFVCHFVY